VSPRRGDGPKRPGKSSAAQRQSILVFTEGKKTEPVYLTHWHRMHRERVIITVDEFHGAPLQLVETAAAQRSADLRAAKRGKGDAYDQYWCVFDVDEHPYVDQRLRARRPSLTDRSARVTHLVASTSVERPPPWETARCSLRFGMVPSR
jgi:RloB-like protein